MASGPTDTSKIDPLLLLIDAMAATDRTGDPSAFIKDMEERGQHEVVASTAIPTDRGDPDEEWEALGFTFDVVHDDAMFQECTLPDGWKREGSGHSMWSYIVDERGVRRVGIFYKAAFYDRRASADLCNVGRSLVSSFTYDNETPDLEQYTIQEIDDYVQGLQDALDKIQRNSDIYDNDGMLRPRVLDEITRVTVERDGRLSS